MDLGVAGLLLLLFGSGGRTACWACGFQLSCPDLEESESGCYLLESFLCSVQNPPFL